MKRLADSSCLSRSTSVPWRALFAVCFSLFACLSFGMHSSRTIAYAQAGANSSHSDSVDVSQAWVTALDAHDVEEALSLLTDEASIILVTPPDATTSIYSGKEQIRQLLAQLAQDNFHTKFVEVPHVVNGTTTWVERETSISLSQADVSYQEVAVDARIGSGKISSVIYEVGDGSIESTNPPAGMGMPRSGRPRALLPIGVFVLGVLSGSSVLCGLYARRVRQTE